MTSELVEQHACAKSACDGDVAGAPRESLAPKTSDSDISTISPFSAVGPSPHPRKLLDAMWPSADLQHQIAVNGAGGQFRNVPVLGVEAALEWTSRITAAGGEVYFACAAYLDSKSRRSDNAAGTWAFWLDLDCGEKKAAEGKGYVSIEAARVAISAFLEKTGLPEPTHTVESGFGLHCYFVVEQFVDREVWQTYAAKLKALAKVAGLIADPARTADIASVMRMPGSLNCKTQPARPVTLISAAAVPLGREAFLTAISDAHARLCVQQSSVAPARTRASTDQSDDYGPPSLPELRSALTTLDPDCDEHTWKLRRIGPLARASVEYPGIADDLRTLAASWSSGELRGNPCEAWTRPGASNGETGEVEFAKVWDRFRKGNDSGQVTTIGTIYYDAARSGWVRPLGRVAANDALATDDVDILQPTSLTSVLDALMARLVKGDVGAPLEAQNIAALATVSSDDEAAYLRLREKMKSANKKVSLTAIDAAVKKQQAKLATAQTHHGYASDLVDGLTIDGWRPVAFEGSIYIVDRITGIWMPMESGRLKTMVAERYDNRPNCNRGPDYASIALHAADLVSSDTFFADAPIGLACLDQFHRLEGDRAIVEVLSPAHRQRVLLPFVPQEQPTPLFERFLHETFASARDGEEAQQCDLLQEITGAVMLGLMPRYQKAVLFYDPYGRAGKGTFESIVQNLVPPNFVTAVSPFRWKEPYFLVTMAGARLNVVGELPENESIPAAEFKSVLGGDPLTGRNPAGRPICFKNSAAHIFMSNHLITSKDHSEAFFARWLIVEFPNSRLKSGLPLDPMLAERIAANELPGIAYWALEGARRLLSNGRFTSSAAHGRLMEKWRRSNSSLDEFIFECCDRGADLQVRRSHLYEHYKIWCIENTRKPFAKGRVKELLEHNVGLGITFAMLNGHEIFRGVCMKPDANEGADHLFDLTP